MDNILEIILSAQDNASEILQQASENVAAFSEETTSALEGMTSATAGVGEGFTSIQEAMQMLASVQASVLPEVTNEINQMIGPLEGAKEGVATVGESASNTGSILGFLGEKASDVFSGIGDQIGQVVELAAAFSLANIVMQFVEAGKSAIEAGMEFQAATASLSTILNNVSDTGESAATGFSGSAGKMSDIAARTADELRNYTEKVKKLNDDMVELNKGQDVIDAQASMYQQLDDLAQQHADKIASLQEQITSVQTSENNTLADMKDSHDNKMADLAEKHTQEMTDAVSQIEKDKLKKKYDEEVQYDNDAYERQYNTKKQQLDRDAAQKIEALQDEIAKENDAYTKKYAAEQEKDQDNIAKLKANNDKKLAQFKQELADEEITYKEHIKRLQEEAASGGGGGLSTKMQELPLNSQFKLTQESAKGLKGFLDQTFEKGTPFKLDDWVEYSKILSEAKVNAQELSPAMENIASANNVNLTTAAQAVFQGMQGNVKGMSSILHISAEELHNAGAEFTQAGTLKDKESFFTALQEIGTKNYAGGLKNYADTLQGASQEISNDFQLMGLHILGFNTANDTVIKGGLLDMMTKAVKNFGDYLEAHHTDIENFFKNLFKAIGDVAHFITSDFNPTMDNLVKLIGNIAKPIVSEFMKVFHDNKGTLQDIADKFNDILKQLDPLWKKFDKDFGPTLKTLTEIIFKLLIKQLDEIVTGFDEVLKVTKKVWDLWDKAPNLGWMNTVAKLAGPLGGFAAHASGTSFAPGGLSLVGENGPELVNLPRGSQVIPNNKISNYMGGNVTIQNVNINNDMDIDTLARRLTMGLKFNSAII